jgi:hypothetical protein
LLFIDSSLFEDIRGCRACHIALHFAADLQIDSTAALAPPERAAPPARR